MLKSTTSNDCTLDCCRKIAIWCMSNQTEWTISRLCQIDTLVTKSYPVNTLNRYSEIPVIHTREMLQKVFATLSSCTLCRKCCIHIYIAMYITCQGFSRFSNRYIPDILRYIINVFRVRYVILKYYLVNTYLLVFIIYIW